MRILILGGTTEASELARRVAGESAFAPLLSLAGRTSAPLASPIPTRTGGFGGAFGLEAFLRSEGIGAVVDATHPFAAVISRNAFEACRRTGVPLIALRRPPWKRRDGDRWTIVPTTEAAVEVLGAAPRRVFLTVGRLDLRPFAAAPQHAYLVRSIEPLGDALPAPDVTALQDRAPFTEAGERQLMERERIEVLVTKNSGGAATYPKMAAARALGLPVVVIARPAKPKDVAEAASADDAFVWLKRLHDRAP